MDTRSTSNRRFQAQYLAGYNLVCAVLWAAVLGRVILLVPLVGFGKVYGGVGQFTKWTQTLALLEIGHSTSGMNIHGSPLYLLGMCNVRIDRHHHARPCPLPRPYDYHAGFVPSTSRLGCSQPISFRHCICSFLQLHATCLVSYRGHPL